MHLKTTIAFVGEHKIFMTKNVLIDINERKRNLITICLKEKVECQFPVGANEEYTDKSHAILKTISAKEDEDSDSDFNMTTLNIFVVYLFLISSFGFILVKN